MNKKYLGFLFLLLVSLFFPVKQVFAMPVGTILYRTSGDNKMYGYNANDLILSEKGKLAHIYSGHTAIYVGKEDGVDYIVEMQPKGAIKVPAKYFINESLGEKLVGAKIPKDATPNQIAKAVAIAKNLANKNLAYDFDFKYQKGPLNSQWTCVGLAEKIYESANISNPTNLGSLVYDPNNYAVDITKDGYDNQSVYNTSGDCFSADLEYSKIERKQNMVIPAPEVIGFDVGILKNDERYIFIPYTQYLQKTLKDVPVDIELSSSFTETDVRGSSPILGLVLKWSLINNPISTFKTLASKVGSGLLAIKEKVFPDSGVALAESSGNYGVLATVSTSTKSTSVKASTTKTSTAKVSATKASTTKTTVAKTSAGTSSGVKIAVTKATSTKGISAGASTSKTVSVSLSTPKNTTTAEVKTTQSTSVKLSTTKATVTPTVVTAPKTTTVVRTTPKTTTPKATSTTPVVTKPTATTTPEVEPEKTPIALIAKIYSNGDDDWLEIINSSDEDFDLAAAGYRLEKAKAGADPTLIMRFGEEADGTYPGGTIIGAHGYYLIARSTASADILAKADAIASKEAFSWTEDGYTLYLGTASISSDTDTDIVDKLGYGDATYYEKASATALKKGYALERKVSATSTIESLTSGGLEELWPRLFDSNDNSNDFILVPYDLSVIESETKPEDTKPESDLFTNPPGLDSENMTQLWHFDECYGSESSNELQTSGQMPVDFKKVGKWAVGRWGCGMAVTKLASSTKAYLNMPLDPNQMTTNFYYRTNEPNFSLVLKFGNPLGSSQQAYIELTPNFTTVYGFPGPEGRLSDLMWPGGDNKWHQVSIVVNRTGGYWSFYLDGREVYSYKYSGIIPSFTTFELTSEYEYVVAIDELSFWDRSLPATEIRSINLLNQPFNPYTWPEKQEIAKLERYWAFDENTGLTAKDSVGTDNFAVTIDNWDMEGRNDSALSINKTIKTTLNSISVTDTSVSFWWRNINYPNDAHLSLVLRSGERNLMSLTLNAANPRFGFNDEGGFIWEYNKSLFPNDKNWHHFALTYDSYRLLLRLYMDGKQIMEREYMKLKDDEKINGLEIIPEGGTTSVDELKIWSGTLTASQVLSEYESLK